MYGTILIAVYFTGLYTTQLLQVPTQATNFADTTSAIAALVGVLVATMTITNWKKSKIQEDSYQIIKSYVAEQVLIETTATEILIEIGSICPLPGNTIPSQTFVTETFQNIDILRKNLSKQYRKIHQIKSELAFWGGKLKPVHEECHETLIKELYNFQVVTDCLRNNLENYFTNGLSTAQQVFQEHEKLADYHNKIYITLAVRKNNKMSEMFTIES